MCSTAKLTDVNGRVRERGLKQCKLLSLVTRCCRMAPHKKNRESLSALKKRRCSDFCRCKVVAAK